MPRFQLRTGPTCTSATGVHSLYTPETSRSRSPAGGPARPRTNAGPCGRLCGGKGWFTLSAGGAGEGADGPDQGEVNHLHRKLNPHPIPAAWSPSFRTRVQNVRFRLGHCTSEPDFHCTKCTFQLRLLHTPTGTGGCAQVFTARRPFPADLCPFQLGTDAFSLIPTKPESLYTPNDAKAGPGQRGPGRPRTGAAPHGRSLAARFWFTLSGGAGERADRQDQ